MRIASRILFWFALAALILGPAAPSAWSRQIQLSFTAQVTTATGTPFGLANMRGKTMTGSFWYDTDTRDTNIDPSRGTYEHSLGFAGFAGTLDGNVFTGSKTPLVLIENISNVDTFGYLDGADSAHPNRIMTVNGVVLPTAQLSLAISSDKNPLNADKLPDPFAFTNSDPHTFSLADKNGQMLLQFTSIKDSSPIPAGLVEVTVRLTDKRGRFLVDGGAYSDSKKFKWPAGSAHIIEYPTSEDGRQYSPALTTRWSFGGWSESTGALQAPSDRVFTILAAQGLEIVGAIGGFQHVVQMNFFGDQIDLANTNGLEVAPAICSAPGTTNPTTLRSGLVYFDGQCYWQSFRTWVAESTHTLTVFPYPGFAFLRWLGGTGGDYTSQFRSITIKEPTVIEAQFTPARRVRFFTDPEELSVTVDDVKVIPDPVKCIPFIVATPATIDPLCVGSFDFAPDSEHILHVDTPQRDRYGKAWVFNGFSNGMGNDVKYRVGPVTFNNNFDTLVAKFVPGVNSVISSKPIGVPIMVNGSPANTLYNVFKPGEEIRLEAPPTATVNGRSLKFKGWSNGGGRVQTAVIPMDAGEYFNVLAEYSIDSQVLITSATPNASVLVNGDVCPLPCPVNGAPGTEVRIEPNPNASLSPLQKMQFVKWSDNGPQARIETLSGEAAHVIEAVFNNSYLLQLSTDPGNGANFETTPASADKFFPEGTKVQLLAKPKPGFEFSRWSGDAAGVQPTVELTLDRSRNAQAQLTRVPYLDPDPVRNAATKVSGAVAPGSVVSIIGESLAFEFVKGPDNPLSQTIYGTSAAVDYYRFLPLKFVSPQELQAVLPSDLTPGEHTISVRRSGYDDVVGKFKVSATAPGIFQSGDKDPSVMAYRPDGSAVSADNPALAGETITVLGTGFGAYVTAPAADGTPLPAVPAYLVAAPVEVVLGSQDPKKVTATGQPGQVGVTSFRVLIPISTPAGDTSLKVSVDGTESPAVTVPVATPPPPAE